MAWDLPNILVTGAESTQGSGIDLMSTGLSKIYWITAKQSEQQPAQLDSLAISSGSSWHSYGLSEITLAREPASVVPEDALDRITASLDTSSAYAHLRTALSCVFSLPCEVEFTPVSSGTPTAPPHERAGESFVNKAINLAVRGQGRVRTPDSVIINLIELAANFRTKQHEPYLSGYEDGSVFFEIELAENVTLVADFEIDGSIDAAIDSATEPVLPIMTRDFDSFLGALLRWRERSS
ncbi:MAG: hypothetical protein HQ477_02100 [Chloroflexi bacterium]|nr:hypothetical protein [Chloroflexota bacterium]